MFQAVYGLEVTAVYYGTGVIYAPFMPFCSEERLQLKLRKLVKTAAGSSVELVISYATLDGEEVDGPPIIYHVPKKSKMKTCV